MTSFMQVSIVIFVLVTLLWLWSIAITNVSIVDLFWGFGYVVANAMYVYLSGDLSPKNILMLILVTIWGLRLTIYLSWRNIGKGEDFRYQKFRQDYGPKRYWWFSYFQTFLLQGALILIVSLPLMGANLGNGEITFLDYLGIIVWLVGFVFEAGGDYQLSKFKRDPQNKGKVLNSGFWKYTRHPNYFGDSAVWWAYGLFSIAAGGYWHAIGSIVMTLLIIKVSGVALLEKTLNSTKPKYREYVEKTNAFFPWFPKK